MVCVGCVLFYQFWNYWYSMVKLPLNHEPLYSFPVNFQSEGINEVFWGVRSSDSLQYFFLSLPFILLGQEASFLSFLTWDSSVIWKTTRDGFIFQRNWRCGNCQIMIKQRSWNWSDGLQINIEKMSSTDLSNIITLFYLWSSLHFLHFFLTLSYQLFWNFCATPWGFDQNYTHPPKCCSNAQPLNKS